MGFLMDLFHKISGRPQTDRSEVELIHYETDEELEQILEERRENLRRKFKELKEQELQKQQDKEERETTENNN